MEGGQKGGLKSGANFPCCIKMTFQRVVGGKGSIGAFSRRFLRVFGVSGEAVPRKGVNLLKTTPKQQKTSAKATEQLCGCPLVPGEAAARLHCPAQAPGRGHLPAAPTWPPALRPAGKPPFWEGLFSKEQFRSACYKRLKNVDFFKVHGGFAVLC